MEGSKEYQMKYLIKRLEEVDCGEKLIETVTEKLTAGDTETARLLLRRHRKTLMDRLHESEKKVDALDLLIYQINKNKL